MDNKRWVDNKRRYMPCLDKRDPFPKAATERYAILILYRDKKSSQLMYATAMLFFDNINEILDKEYTFSKEVSERYNVFYEFYEYLTGMQKHEIIILT